MGTFSLGTFDLGTFSHGHFSLGTFRRGTFVQGTFVRHPCRLSLYPGGGVELSTPEYIPTACEQSWAYRADSISPSVLSPSSRSPSGSRLKAPYHIAGPPRKAIWAEALVAVGGMRVSAVLAVEFGTAASPRCAVHPVDLKLRGPEI